MIKIPLLLLALTFPLLGKKKQPIDIPALIKQADRYELPKPPKESELTLIHFGWTSMIDDRYLPRYESAFLLERNENESALVMAGFQTLREAKEEKEHPLILPYTRPSLKPHSKDYHHTGTSLNEFGVAIQCARRGELKRAKKLIRLYQSDDYHKGFKTLENGHRYTKNLPLLLARATFEFYYQEVRRAEADLPKGLKHLEALQTEFPKLFSDNPDDFYENYRTQFVEDLRLTIASPKPKKGSVEDLLFQLSKTDHWEDEEEHEKLRNRIYLMGVSAIPELVRLADSRLLTTKIIHGLNNSPDGRARLRRFAGSVLSDMVGEHDKRSNRPYHDPSRKKWLRTVDLSDERKFFIEAIPPGVPGFRDDTPLRILLHRDPEAAFELLKVAVGLRLQKYTPYVMDSRLAEDGKVRFLLLAFLRPRGLEFSSLKYLLPRREKKAVAKEFNTLIKTYPEKLDEDDRPAGAQNLTQIVTLINDQTVWKNYLAKVKAANDVLRPAFLATMDQPGLADKTRKLRLAFLAVFLENTEDEPDQSIQNLAAQKIASILEIPGDPADHWKEKQWTPYRKKVEAALAKITLPDLTPDN
jgi:hypothetical protein